MNGVNKTLYIPLYGKAYVSKKGILLQDKKAEEIWAAEGFALKGKAKSKWLAYYMGMRARVFDDWVRRQLADAEDAVVIHIGCGMDSRALRVGAEKHAWYDVDFPAVMEERKRYYTETANYHMLAGDAREGGWLEKISAKKRAIVVMEGISMYLTAEELQACMARLCARFAQVALLMDCYTVLAARLSKYKNPINEVGVTQVYGVDDPVLLQQGALVYRQEHLITPQNYIAELQGAEQAIFKKLYAGTFAKKLYRLYEYRKG